MPSKISKFVKTIGVVNQVFKPSVVQQHTRLNIYRTLSRPVLIYGSEAWTIRTAAENKTASSRNEVYEENFWLYTPGPQNKGGNFKKLKVEPIFKFIQNYWANWREHIEGMDSSRIPNNLLNYRPPGKRSLGKPLKRWSETVTDHLA
jgi:hypothetical protein